MTTGPAATPTNNSWVAGAGKRPSTLSTGSPPLPTNLGSDLGCGTGALSATIQQQASPRRILGVEPAATFVATAQRRHGNDRTQFEVGDATDIPLASAQADLLVSGLALNFFPDPAGAMSEMRRVVRSGGTIAIYLWDYAGEMQFLRRFWDTAVARDPAAATLDEGVRFPICRPEPLRRLFADAGLQDVSVAPLDTPTEFANFDDLWQPFLGGVGPATKLCRGPHAGRTRRLCRGAAGNAASCRRRHHFAHRPRLGGAWHNAVSAH